MDDYIIVEEYKGYEIIEYQNEYYIRFAATGRFYGKICNSIHDAKRYIDYIERR